MGQIDRGRVKTPRNFATDRAGRGSSCSLTWHVEPPTVMRGGASLRGSESPSQRPDRGRVSGLEQSAPSRNRFLRPAARLVPTHETREADDLDGEDRGEAAS